MAVDHHHRLSIGRPCLMPPTKLGWVTRDDTHRLVGGKKILNNLWPVGVVTTIMIFPHCSGLEIAHIVEIGNQPRLRCGVPSQAFLR
jgi:hypothetical protein